MNRDPNEIDTWYRHVRDGARQAHAHLKQSHLWYKGKSFPMRDGQEDARKERLEKMKRIIKELSELDAYVSEEWSKTQEEKKEAECVEQD